MDISEFHERMRDKYAEKQQHDHRLWRTLEISVLIGLVILVSLWYAGM